MLGKGGPVQGLWLFMGGDKVAERTGMGQVLPQVCASPGALPSPTWGAGPSPACPACPAALPRLHELCQAAPGAAAWG